jgi:hypothetical protein
MLKHGCAVVLLTLATACGDSATTIIPASPASPTPAPTPTPTPRPSPGETFVLTGQVTDSDTAAPVAGATLYIDGYEKTTTDSSGNYSLTGTLRHEGARSHSFTLVFAGGYEADYHHIEAYTQNVRLHRIERITAGDSKEVTVRPDDTLCSNNMQDDASTQTYRCRSVRVVAPSDGVMTLEAVATQGGAHPPLEAEIVSGGASPCCDERIENPTSIQVKAGTEVIADIELLIGIPAQSFTLKTSMAAK